MISCWVRLSHPLWRHHMSHMTSSPSFLISDYHVTIVMTSYFKMMTSRSVDTSPNRLVAWIIPWRTHVTSGLKTNHFRFTGQRWLIRRDCQSHDRIRCHLHRTRQWLRFSVPLLKHHYDSYYSSVWFIVINDSSVMTQYWNTRIRSLNGNDFFTRKSRFKRKKNSTQKTKISQMGLD